MGRTGVLIDGIQKRLDDIETEATRLMVFANITSDAALRIRLKKIAKILFRNATEIESRLKKLRYGPGRFSTRRRP
jgi:hypothetical protein